jgi:phosphoglycolate phosphatase
VKAERRLATRILLFDVDGTLVLTGGAGVRGMSRAFEQLFSIPNAFQTLEVPGRTDSWILSEALALHGISCSAADRARFRDIYFEYLRAELHRPGPRKGMMPGVRPLLDALQQRDDVYLALLTGNYEEAACRKLEYFDLWRYFRCGAFGDEAPDRNGLLPKALARIRECGGPAVSARDAIVIGDTPLDVACAAAGGARSMAVATGRYDVDALRATGADVVLEDLSDLDVVLRALGLA